MGGLQREWSSGRRLKERTQSCDCGLRLHCLHRCLGVHELLPPPAPLSPMKEPPPSQASERCCHKFVVFLTFPSPLTQSTVAFPAAPFRRLALLRLFNKTLLLFFFTTPSSFAAPNAHTHSRKEASKDEQEVNSYSASFLLLLEVFPFFCEPL